MNKFWQRWAIGNSSRDTSVRRIGWGIPQNGWQWFFDTYIEPSHTWLNSGSEVVEPKVMLHNPFGVSPTGSFTMRASQYVGALEAQLDKVTKRFKRTWRPFIEDGGELLMYFGTPYHDPRFQADLRDGRIDNWVRLMWRSYRIAMDIGASIAIDTMAARPEGGLDHRMYQLMEELMKYNSNPSRMYIEASPGYTLPHWHQSHVTMVEDTFRKRHVIRTQEGYVRQFPEFQGGQFWDKRAVDADPTAPMTVLDGYGGDMLRIIRLKHERNPEYIRRVLADGHSVAVTPYHLRWGTSWEGNWRYTPDELFVS